jgi:hypothetical protein
VNVPVQAPAAGTLVVSGSTGDLARNRRCGPGTGWKPGAASRAA